ncbi:MAG: hypothetical protein QM765_34135 [Myxococcales bacterium]
MALQLKTICYRGGLVTFRIPAHWKEEYEPDGGGTFYEEGLDTGTLRLNVLSAESGGKATAAVMLETVFKSGTYEELTGGFRLRRSIKATDRGILLRRWEVGVPVLESELRIYCFTHTVLAAKEADAKTQVDLALVDEAVRTATYSQERGVALH